VILTEILQKNLPVGAAEIQKTGVRVPDGPARILIEHLQEDLKDAVWE
jgi:hypothetical protein